MAGFVAIVRGIGTRKLTEIVPSRWGELNRHARAVNLS
jgi:hypothetical protein